jgi:hypothetical protein
LLNSIHVFNVVWPADCAATTLLLVHVGQSGQPRPDDDRRTAAPVEMITALAITDARAQPRSDLGVGCQTGAISRESTRPMLTLCSRARSARVDNPVGRVSRRGPAAPDPERAALGPFAYRRCGQRGV